jgi:hypothetical protein
MTGPETERNGGAVLIPGSAYNTGYVIDAREASHRLGGKEREGRGALAA